MILCGKYCNASCKASVAASLQADLLAAQEQLLLASWLPVASDCIILTNTSCLPGHILWCPFDSSHRTICLCMQGQARTNTQGSGADVEQRQDIPVPPREAPQEEDEAGSGC